MCTVYLMVFIMCGNAVLYSIDQFIIIQKLESTCIVQVKCYKMSSDTRCPVLGARGPCYFVKSSFPLKWLQKS